MTRRLFIAAIAAIVATTACALRGAPHPSISGYVFRTGIRFGRRDMRVPNVPVMLSQFTQTPEGGRHPLRVVAKTRTNADGEYHFEGIAPGWYYVQAVGGPWRLVKLDSQPLWVNIFNEFRPFKQEYHADFRRRP